MAKASWAVVNPSQGSGSKTVNVSSDGAHTGREVRSTTLTITAANVTPVNVTVNQAGKPAYVQNNSDTASAAKGGQNVTISGTANSKKLTFTLGNGDLSISLPATYTLKLGEKNLPENFYQFNTIVELQEFYAAGVDHLIYAYGAGWQKIATFDWQVYIDELDKL